MNIQQILTFNAKIIHCTKRKKVQTLKMSRETIQIQPQKLAIWLTRVSGCLQVSSYDFSSFETPEVCNSRANSVSKREKFTR